MYDVNVNREAAFTTYSYRLKYPIGDTQFWIEKIKYAMQQYQKEQILTY